MLGHQFLSENAFAPVDSSQFRVADERPQTGTELEPASSRELFYNHAQLAPSQLQISLQIALN